jgi:hypothetical protein
MDLVVFSRAELPIALRALRTVALKNGLFTEMERDFISALAHLHGGEVDVRALAPITPGEVAARVIDPHHRKRLVQLALVTALIEGEPDHETLNEIRDLAAALDIRDSGLEVLREVVDGHLFLARFDMARRLRGAMLPKDMTLAKLVKQMLPFFGIASDEKTAAKYRALGQCAPGTFGRAFHDHYVEHGFAFPGEKNGIIERGTFHDAGHVLSGYDVDPAGEIQQASFQAGFMRKDGFVVLLFGLLQFHMGLRITPIAKAERGYFDVKKVIRAAERGAACKVDLSDGWDLFSVADVPLAELRASYGITPIEA